MFKRNVDTLFKSLAKDYPVVTLTGPRQSGKTTLSQMAFPQKSYVSLEDPQVREFAKSDPRRFLAQYPDGAILDEIQRTPDIPSYLQGIVDEKKKNGLYILTGSQNFQLIHSVNQSLAGRTALLTLLPLTLDEIQQTGKNLNLDEQMRYGFYPRIYNEKLEPSMAYRGYIATYVERDIRQLENIRNLDLFQKFVALCAGRMGQLVNLSSLGNEVGVSSTTLQHWLTLLRASYIVYLLKPFHKNWNKRMVKMPKLYFYDTGLASALLGIENENHMATHPLRGSLFENMIVMEFLKIRCNRGTSDNLYFFRDYQENEVDLILELGPKLAAVEVKSSQTFTPDYFTGLKYLEKITGKNVVAKKSVIYGGAEDTSWSYAPVFSWLSCNKFYDTVTSSR